MRGEVIWIEDTLTPGLAEFVIVAQEGIERFLEEMAERVQDYAQSNAPWDDRTGEARRGLTAEVSSTGDMGVITLYHTQTYGIWLEVRWSGRYAIIVPTIEHYGPIIMAELEGFIDTL